MQQLSLRYESENGIEDIGLESGRVSFGRGSEADRRFPDDGLSRLHATVYCEDGRVWIVDENSTNGSMVNGQPVGESGTPLAEGDVIKIGHHTNLRLVVVEPKTEKPVGNGGSENQLESPERTEPASLLVPLAVIGVAFVLIVSSIAVIAFTVYSGPGTEVVANETSEPALEPDDPESPIKTGNSNAGTASPSPSPSGGSSPETILPDPGNSPGANLPPSPPDKQYSQMTTDEKNLYIKNKAEKVARLIGNKNTGDIPPAAVESIKRFVDQYASRFRAARRDDCGGRGSFTRSDMESVLQRASKNVPFITRSFRTQAVDPQVGIYVAMIESEHCVCLQSGTGPLGMFQFTKATGETFGLATKSGASPTNPDERCEPLPASLASAKYLKYLSGRLGTGPLSVPLAIASYNSGEGGLGQNLMTALTSDSSEDRSFWTLVANADKLSKQFKSENIKYVPKFFAAAIVGENPRDFGSSMQPLSSYTR